MVGGCVKETMRENQGEMVRVKAAIGVCYVPHSALSTGTVDNFRQVEVCKVE
jgi:hypothetical protein